MTEMTKLKAFSSKSTEIDKMFTQVVKMSLQDFKAKKEVSALRQCDFWAVSSVG